VKRVIFLILLFLIGCTPAMQQSMTPSAKTVVHDFDNHIEVIQLPVSAASSMNEGLNALGFRWTSKAPDIVRLKVGTKEITNIYAVAFNIDGAIVNIEKPIDTPTNYGGWSYRQFAMTLGRFVKLANAQIVKMKVFSVDYSNNLINILITPSSFGQSKSSAVVSGKFSGFLEQVNAQRNK
jgi:hypothetical protein